MTDISHDQVKLTTPSGSFPPEGRIRIKDSILLIIVFIVGLIGSFYILHLTLKNNAPKPDSMIGVDARDDNALFVIE